MLSLLLLLSSPLVSAVNLYVASRTIVTSLSLTSNSTGGVSLQQTYTNNGCADDPSWLTFDEENRILYCFDDDVSNNGSVSSYSVAASGELTQINRVLTPNGPVSGVIYGEGETRGLLVANYHSQSIATYSTTTSGLLTRLETFVVEMDAPGPNPTRQNEPHPHQAILDPSGKFIFVPDLGADLVRFFSFENGIDKLTVHEPLVHAPGSGPRHVAFWESEGNTYMYVLAEIASTVTTYVVNYTADGGLEFEQVFAASSLGPDTVAASAMASEIIVSPDGRFLTVSNRNDRSAVGGQDSLVVFELLSDGGLEFVQKASAGGFTPRHFSLNKAGNLVAVGLQGNNAVSILDRDPETGEIGAVLATIAAGQSPACVLWDE